MKHTFALICLLALCSSALAGDSSFHLPISRGAMIRRLWGEDEGLKYCDRVDEHDDLFCFCPFNNEDNDFPLVVQPLSQTHVIYNTLFEKVTASELNLKISRQIKVLRSQSKLDFESQISTTPRTAVQNYLQHHQIWINEEISPPFDFARRFSYNTKNLGGFKKITYNPKLWTFGTSKENSYFHDLKERIGRGGFGKLSELEFKPRTADLLERLYQEKRYSIMAEIIKYYILYEEKGVYGDYDILVETSLAKGFLEFDYFAIADGKTVLPWFMSVRVTKSPLMKEMIDLIENMDWEKQLPFTAGNPEWAQLLNSLWTALWIHRSTHPYTTDDKFLLLGLDETQKFKRVPLMHDNIGSARKGLYDQPPSSVHHSFNFSKVQENLLNGLYDAEPL